MATATRSKKKKMEHCVMGNNCFQCLNCGRKQDLPMPIDVAMFGAMAKQFEKSHKDCKPTWKPPVNESEGKTEEENAQWWLSNGERGTSSETMFGYLHPRKIKITKRECHPYDPDDFRRCYLLLKAVPQWKEKLFLMKEVSPVWSRLVNHWNDLTDMLEKAMALPDGKAPEMYDLMKKLGC